MPGVLCDKTGTPFIVSFESVIMRLICGFGCILLIAIVLATCGCTTTPTSPGTPLSEQAPTLAPQGADDTQFLTMYANSASDIESKLDSVNANFYPAAQNTGITYSPSKLRLSALDLKNSAEQYHTSMLKIEKFAGKENEYLRNEYLGYLSSIKTAGGNIAEAAQAEGANDYRLAMNYAELAKTTLERIEGVPDADHQAQIEVMKVNLEDMITRMKGAISS